MEEVKILIVEDDYSAAIYLKNLLTDIGYKELIMFSSGEDVIEYLKNKTVDIILMDIELDGELDGIETIKLIQQHHNPFVIYITALRDKMTFQRAKATFPKDFLSKPFNEYKLLDIIDTTIKNSSYTNEAVSFYNNHFFAKDYITKAYKKFCVSDIVYLKAERSYTDIYIRLEKKHEEYYKKITVVGLIHKILNCLNSENLLRIHKSYAVNVNYIEAIEGSCIKLEDIEESFNVQPAYKDAFKKSIKKL